MFHLKTLIIIKILILLLLIIIISIFKEDNVFSMTANFPYGPPVNTDTGYIRLFFSDFFFFVSVAMLVVRYVLEVSRISNYVASAASVMNLTNIAPTSWSCSLSLIK